MFSATNLMSTIQLHFFTKNVSFHTFCRFFVKPLSQLDSRTIELQSAGRRQLLPLLQQTRELRLAPTYPNIHLSKRCTLSDWLCNFHQLEHECFPIHKDDNKTKESVVFLKLKGISTETNQLMGIGKKQSSIYVAVRLNL